MANAFSQLPKDASLNTICGEAGQVFAARKENNPQTDFNTEIWYLAGDAMRAGFSALRGMTKEQIARAMGDSIVSHINTQRYQREKRIDERLDWEAENVRSTHACSRCEYSGEYSRATHTLLLNGGAPGYLCTYHAKEMAKNGLPVKALP